MPEEKPMKKEGLDRSKSSSVNPCRTGKHGFKSLPLHYFPFFTGETRQRTEKRFEPVNTSTLEGRF